MIAETLRRIDPTAKNILFGSEARGESTADSDIDILILVDGTKVSIERELCQGVSVGEVVRNI